MAEELTGSTNIATARMKLMKVQQKLRVPKDRRNDFGKYAFRNASDILEAVKPILEENKSAIVLDDTVRDVGEGVERRFYVVATATFVDCESGGQVAVDGWAREELTKKGMDAAQITGACSSYARKYALCGLLAIDDSRLDPDETNKGDGTATPAAPIPPRATPAPAAKPNPARPSAEALAAAPTPIAKKRVVAHEPNARARAAWQAFSSLENIKALDKATREEVWAKTLTACTHKARASEITTDAEWDKVDSYIKLLAGEVK